MSRHHLKYIKEDRQISWEEQIIFFTREKHIRYSYNNRDSLYFHQTPTTVMGKKCWETMKTYKGTLRTFLPVLLRWLVSYGFMDKFKFVWYFLCDCINMKSTERYEVWSIVVKHVILDEHLTLPFAHLLSNLLEQWWQCDCKLLLIVERAFSWFYFQCL